MMPSQRIVPFAQVVMLLFVGLALAACANQMRGAGNALAGGNGATGPVKPGSPREFSVSVGSTVYFTTDSSEITDDARKTLAAQAKWLNKYPQYSVTLAGHADERGTREYNIALGAKRASAVRNYLVSLGVSVRRMRTISYGKERPVAVCNDISCWSQNRRVETVLNRRAGG